tara:strand:+ start:1197 stop:1409 length:213 start_codon:yes stop_codon:yes gene_type:complete
MPKTKKEETDKLLDDLKGLSVACEVLSDLTESLNEYRLKPDDSIVTRAIKQLSQEINKKIHTIYERYTTL